jgi:iron complex outermembrane receptor protein
MPRCRSTLRRVLRLRRRLEAHGRFRPASSAPPGDGRNVPAVYPNGFLPKPLTTVKDASLRRRLPPRPRRRLEVRPQRQPRPQRAGFHERQPINVSYWYEPKPGGGIYAASPLEADTGTLKFNQTTFNADLKGR